MKYLNDNPNWNDVKSHIVNKNIGIIYDNPNFIQKVLTRLLKVIIKWQIKVGGGKLVVSEQIVENTLVLRNIREKDKTILDFGGYESILPLQLSAIGYRVTVWDKRKYPFSHPNLNVICSDIFSKDLKIVEKFDVILSISTIEHVGLGHYGDTVVEDGDKKAVEILWSLLKEGGRLMVSIPAGKSTIHKGYRVYNEEKIRDIFPTITSIKWFAKNTRDGIWNETNSNTIGDICYSEPNGIMPVEAVAFVICDK